jgi:uncharacterized membrane protein (UPF0136 family)
MVITQRVAGPERTLPRTLLTMMVQISTLDTLMVWAPSLLPNNSTKALSSPFVSSMPMEAVGIPRQLPSRIPMAMWFSAPALGFLLMLFNMVAVVRLVHHIWQLACSPSELSVWEGIGKDSHWRASMSLRMPSGVCFSRGHD